MEQSKKVTPLFSATCHKLTWLVIKWFPLSSSNQEKVLYSHSNQLLFSDCMIDHKCVICIFVCLFFELRYQFSSDKVKCDF